MFFSPDYINDLCEKIRVTDVIGQKVKLQRKGGKYLGLCPFHSEKTPSFNVDPIKNMYYCFGCHESGNAISFVQKTKGLDFIDAVKSLANEFGIELPKEEVTARSQSNARLHEVMEMAAKWFNERLHSTQGAAAIKYLTNRGIDNRIIKTFNIGFSPNQPDLLYKALSAKNVTTNEMVDAGLISVSKGNVYDRFRGRITFPIYNQKSKIIGFGGRILEATKDSPKYLNSPETILFKKGHSLYAENLVLASSGKDKKVVVVEGYMDVIGLYNAGITDVVATLGTAMTIEHIQKIWRYCPNPIICLDGDKAGIAAMERCSKLVLPILKPGFSLQFVKLPDGNDPDDAVRNFGAAYVSNLLLNPISLSEALLESETKKLNPKSPEQKALLQKTLSDLADQISDNNIKQHYKRFFIDKLWESQNKFKSKKITVNTPSKLSMINVRNLSALQRSELSLVALILENPVMLKSTEIYNDYFRIESANDIVSEISQVIEEIHANIADLEDENYSEKFKELIAEKIQASKLNYICGPESYFIDKITIRKDNILLHLWQEAFNNYNLELLKAEYREKIQSYDEKSLQHAQKIKEQINQLELEISKSYN